MSTADPNPLFAIIPSPLLFPPPPIVRGIEFHIFKRQSIYKANSSSPWSSLALRVGVSLAFGRVVVLRFLVDAAAVAVASVF